MARSADSVSTELERWLQSDGEKTLGSLVELFEEKSFAILFVLLLGVPALPLPTGGATHVFEIIAVLLALQLIAGPRARSGCRSAGASWSSPGPRQRRFIAGLMRFIRRLERFSRPRLTLPLRSPAEQHRLRAARHRRVRRRLPRPAVHRARHAAGARRRAAVARRAARGLPRRRRWASRSASAGVVPGDRARQGGDQGHRQALLDGDPDRRRRSRSGRLLDALIWGAAAGRRVGRSARCRDRRRRGRRSVP